MTENIGALCWWRWPAHGDLAVCVRVIRSIVELNVSHVCQMAYVLF